MDLDGKKVAIIATDLFEQAELTEPKAALEEAGVEVTIIAPHDGEIQGMNHDEKADTIPVDITLDLADPADYDALLIPGGAMNSDALRVNERAQAFAQAIDEAGKPLAVICHGPWLLINAHLVDGRKMTSYHTIAEDLKNAGADWVNQEVVVDGHWVSSRQPDDIAAFSSAFMELLGQEDTGDAE
jgi:protease I